MERKIGILKATVSIVVIPPVLILFQGLVFPFLLVFSDSPDWTIYLSSAAVVFGWVGIAGLLHTVYMLGSDVIPGATFVAVTLFLGLISLGLAVHISWFSWLVVFYASAVMLLAIYTTHCWAANKRNQAEIYSGGRFVPKKPGTKQPPP